MISVALLLTWVALGLIVTLVWPEPGEPRLAWAPMAILFGPLWFVIAAERRQQPIVVPVAREGSNVGLRVERDHRPVLGR